MTSLGEALESLNHVELRRAFAVLYYAWQVIRVADEGRDSLKLCSSTLICGSIDLEFSIVFHYLINCVAACIKHDDITESDVVLYTRPSAKYRDLVSVNWCYSGLIPR